MARTALPRRSGRIVAALGATALVVSLAACAGSGASGGGDVKDKTLRLAYFSFAIENSYDAPMLAAAKKAAKDENAELTVYDANNNAQTQFSQVQDAIASGRFDGFLVQAVDGTTVIPLVTRALNKGIKVAALDQTMGPDLTTTDKQVKGLSASVTFTSYGEGEGSAKLAKQACAQLKADPCRVGYLFDIKASTHGQAQRKGFDTEAKGSPIQVVAEGEAQFNANGGLTAAQTILQARPDLDIIIASDQGMQGAYKAVAAAGREKDILLVATGGSRAGLKAVAAGQWFGTVVSAPATEGELATKDLITAIRTGKDQPARDGLAKVPHGGVATQDTVADFTGEWEG